MKNFFMEDRDLQQSCTRGPEVQVAGTSYCQPGREGYVGNHEEEVLLSGHQVISWEDRRRKMKGRQRNIETNLGTFYFCILISPIYPSQPSSLFNTTPHHEEE